MKEGKIYYKKVPNTVFLTLIVFEINANKSGSTLARNPQHK